MTLRPCGVPCCSCPKIEFTNWKALYLVKTHRVEALRNGKRSATPTVEALRNSTRVAATSWMDAFVDRCLYQATTTNLPGSWADRVIGLLAPFAKEVPYMRAVQGDNTHQEYLDLLGDTRYRTLRIHCLCFESIQRLGFNSIPWKEHDVRRHLNTILEQEVTPHKVEKEGHRCPAKGCSWHRQALTQETHGPVHLHDGQVSGGMQCRFQASSADQPGGLQANREDAGAAGMAKQDCERSPDQEENGASHCTALLLFRHGLVDGAHPVMGPSHGP